MKPPQSFYVKAALSPCVRVEWESLHLSEMNSSRPSSLPISFQFIFFHSVIVRMHICLIYHARKFYYAYIKEIKVPFEYIHSYSSTIDYYSRLWSYDSFTVQKALYLYRNKALWLTTCAT